METLYMTAQEIVRPYLQADDKNVQIGILSQLNLCRRKTIIAILEREGVYEGSRDDDGAPTIIKRGGRHHGIEEQDKMFLHLYHQGLNDHQIAVESGVSRSTVLSWRNKRNLPANREPGWNGKQLNHTSAQADT